MREQEMKKSVVVVGLGAFGLSAAQTLAKQGAEVIVIESDRNRTAVLDEESVQIVHADARERDLLLEAGIEDVDVGIVAIGEDIESSLIATLQLKELGIPEIYARTVSPAHREILIRIGVAEDHILRVEEDAGISLANHIMNRNTLELFPLENQYSITETVVPESVKGKVLREMELRKKYELSIVGVRRVDYSVDEDGSSTAYLSFFLPTADTRLEEDDRLIVVGTKGGIERFLQSGK